MHVLEASQHPRDHPLRVLFGQAAAVGECVAELATFQKLHDEYTRIIFEEIVVQLDQVGMPEALHKLELVDGLID
eukprot:scaffold142927_cov40-Prasinocladus_malaysianus.AAC.2